MTKKNMKAIDGNFAAAYASYALTDVAAIYPITPSSPMGEHADAWSAYGKKNIFGREVEVTELQSEGGASGAVHGALSAGALTTTYTASQGLLLMVPNLYKMAGELLPGVLHVSARSVATHALSIFGDHSDVMACRQIGTGMVASGSVQEAQDLAVVAHIAALNASIPFIHFFDGFRTSHEISKIDMIDYEDIKKIAPYEAIKAFKNNAMRPEKPILKGTAENPDIFFQARESANSYYIDAPYAVQDAMDSLYSITGRRYNLFDYHGHPDAEKVIIIMGTGAEAVHETVDHLVEKGEKVGVIKVRLYRPFSSEHFLRVLPSSVKTIATLDRTKEPGSEGEPLYKDVATLLFERRENVKVVGGRYGLSSKEFTPGMVKSVFDNLSGLVPKNQFTVGIRDDVTETSLDYGKLDTVKEGTVQCKFWGYGSDGTVGASKNSIKIIGNNTEQYAQGYFSYDSKKSGGLTVSHLRFGKEKIRAPYLINNADYIGCHKHSYVYRYDLVDGLKEGGIFVLNTIWKESDIEENLPSELKKAIAEKDADFYIINAVKIAESLGLGERINTIMQTAFFKLSKVLPFEEAKKLQKKAISDTYGKKGEKIVKMNQDAVEKAAESLHKVDFDRDEWLKAEDKQKMDTKKVHEEYDSPEEEWVVSEVVDKIAAQKGDDIPVSVFANEDRGVLPGPDGSFPVGLTRFEKRGTAINVPKWNSEYCIQCNQCSFVCPHAAIRPVLLNKEEVEEVPETFNTLDALGKDMKQFKYRIQLYPMDCVGCGNCADVCPAPKGNALEMVKFDEIVEKEALNNNFALKLPVRDELMNKYTVKGSQFQKPLFEFSGACAGCGETPYYKLATQLFGDRMVIANATGCSSIYGGTAPNTPFCKDKNGNAPVWANSLFEDNAEYGYGMALACRNKMDRIESRMKEILEEDCKGSCQCKTVSEDLKNLFKEWIGNRNDADRTKELAPKIKYALEEEAAQCDALDDIYEHSDYLIKKSVWSVGGDGWAYDIGYGGLDHVIASGEDINILVLDTEVYSNTGGQSSKASQLGQVAKFAASGKKLRKKNLGVMAMTYGYVYVASVSMGANYNQLVKAMKEAEQYNGPSLIIAYSPCINHGCNMSKSQKEMKLAVETGYWPLYRYNPDLKKDGKNSFVLDSKEPSKKVKELINQEVRYTTLKQEFPEEAERLQKLLQEDVDERWKQLKNFSENGF